MPRNLIGVGLMFAAVASALAPGIAAANGDGTGEVDARMQESRELTREFQQRLKTELEAAIAQGGPVGAIAVCRERAPRIAAELSAASGASISRTALRVRNPANAPQPWQREAMERFEQRMAAGEPADRLELFETPDGQGARYMKAIPTGPLCLTCHGSHLAADVQSALREMYPQDAATGFAAGDLRGAFSVVWPAEGEAP
ncbi:MAG: DUF3365 domain-containing protein [Gammaproteobacteria bacterium]